MTTPFVIARRAAPWQSVCSCNRRWIASFLAMTGWGRNDHPFRHCEARSAVAIHVLVQPPMDCFVPRNDRAGAQ
jgi:hypothetical protein